jgi:hypothetical protein
MKDIIEALKACYEGIKLIIPLMRVNPPWSRWLFVITGFLLLASVIAFAVNYPEAKRKLNSAGQIRPDDYPYREFPNDFPSVVAPYRIPKADSIINIVWGDIGRIRETAVVIPINEDFDLEQRGPSSVLTAFGRHTIQSRAFFDYLEEQWPAKQRPKNAGIGTIEYKELPHESSLLKGALFVVTTRNQSNEKRDYGYYKNTSMAAVEYLLDQVVEKVKYEQLDSVALPLLGTGYAIVKNDLDENGKELFEQAVLLLTVQKLADALADPAAPWRRATIVMYTKDIRGAREDRHHDAVLIFLNSDTDTRKKTLKDLVESLPKPGVQSKATAN